MKFPLFFAALLLLSSCIKVEEANLCPNAPPAPSLGYSSITVSTSKSTDTLSVLNPDASVSYTWLAPYGFKYTGAVATVDVSYGNWAVIEKNGSCTSDTTKFSMIPLLNGCTGVGLDTVKMGTSITDKVRNIYNYNYPGSYYELQFQDVNGSTLDVYFAAKPVAGSYYIVGSSYDLTNTECYVSYNDQYESIAGNVYVSVSGSITTVEFCGAYFHDTYAGSQVGGSAYLKASL